KLKQTLKTDANGEAKTSFTAKNLQRWSPTSPKLYQVKVATAKDQVAEQIGFRNVWVKGEDIFLNDKPIFLKSISFHEEIPQRKGRAFSEADAVMLLSEAKALGCNMIRLAHYPQNEYIVRMAEKMGFLLWEEIPIWQGIDFKNEATKEKAGKMMAEMVMRDKNRCALTFWGVANETQPSEPRNAFIRHLIETTKSIDTTRLLTAAFDLVRFNRDRQVFVMDDPFIKELDVVAVNKYMGWYHPWPISPEKATWDVAKGQPLIVSEFGGEALYGKTGDADLVSSWSEDYQATLYRENLEMFKHIPNLRGTSPWVLFDFRSPFRFHPTNQEDWNRKGLVSDQGYRKKAWYLMKEYYDGK
ncbi:MAG: glycoside hydrolase family 2, partial [Pedobacter sp.]